MKLPAGRQVPGCTYNPLPYYLVGDEIFSLKNWLMKNNPFTTTDIPDQGMWLKIYLVNSEPNGRSSVNQ